MRATTKVETLEEMKEKDRKRGKERTTRETDEN